MKQQKKSQKTPQSAQKHLRLMNALRANLRKRKIQVRARNQPASLVSLASEESSKENVTEDLEIKVDATMN